MSSALAAALKDEVKHESKEYSRPDIVASGPPAPFVLQETPGDTLLTLTRDFNGETVSVDLQVNNQPEADDFTEGGEDGGADGAALAINSVAFNVAVRRAGGKHQLVFDCESNGNEVLIMHVSHEPVGGAAPEEKPFTGPVFSELDEALIREFRAYLTERGVDADLGEYLRHLVHDKEQREYAAWLQRTHDFVAKK